MCRYASQATQKSSFRVMLPQDNKRFTKAISPFILFVENAHFPKISKFKDCKMKFQAFSLIFKHFFITYHIVLLYD